MKHFESKPVVVSRSASAVYDIFFDFNNFRGFLPTDRIEQFSCTQTSCTITAKGLPTITLDMTERVPQKRVLYSTHDQRPMDIRLGLDINALSDTSSELKFFIDAEIEGVTSMMLSKPFQNLLDTIANKIKEMNF